MSITLLERAAEATKNSAFRRTVSVLLPIVLVGSAHAYTLSIDFANAGFVTDETFTDAGSVGGDYEFDNTMVKMFGGISISGADWDSMSNGGSLAFELGGTVNGTIQAGTRVKLDYDFDMEVTGGMANWDLVNAVYATSNDFHDLRFNFAEGRVDSSAHLTGHMTSNAFDVDETDGTWYAILTVDWSGYSSEDVLTVDIPQHSIDTSLSEAVPEPASLAVVGLGVLGLLRRRRDR